MNTQQLIQELLKGVALLAFGALIQSRRSRNERAEIIKEQSMRAQWREFEKMKRAVDYIILYLRAKGEDIPDVKWGPEA